MHVDPLAQLCVTCGSTEAMISSLLGVIDPGDEVVIFEPYYGELPTGDDVAFRRKRHSSTHSPIEAPALGYAL
jgi:hypothetical protein